MQSILIVEDEPLVALEWKETLEAAGYRVDRTIDSADLVLSAVHEAQPDLILMDIRLKSYLDGVDATQRLRLFTQTPVVFLTAWSSPDVQARAQRSGGDGYLVKPVDPPALLSAVRQALAHA